MLTEKDNLHLINLKIYGRNCERLWYKVGKNILNLNPNFLLSPGMILKVPLQKTECYAIVDNTSLTTINTEELGFAVKEILAIIPQPNDITFYKFANEVAKLYLLNLEDLYATFIDLISKCQKTIKNLPASLALQPKIQLSLTSPSIQKQDLTLTSEQQNAVTEISAALKKSNFAPFLLFGVTGSGKTEVYKQSIINVAIEGKSTIFLLPEIGLCEKFFETFKALENFNIKVLRYHSSININATRETLAALDQDSPVLLLGVHLPIFLPMKNLGLIIVDEEHETGYCRQSAPQIDSKQMAILRAKHSGIPIVLGSATPSINTFFLAQQAPWKILRLTKKISAGLRNIDVANLTSKEKRCNFWLTKKLEEAISLRLSKGEQSIIFLNRRGHSFYAQCKSCGFILQCKNCSVSLTVHHKNKLVSAECHYCMTKISCPTICPDCQKVETFTFKGIGTQKITEILETRFPQAKILRMDLDSAKNKKDWTQTTKDIFAGRIDIIVGTQSITKGYHFPRVTLVGVIWADLDFNFPTYNAQEIAIQRLLQVSGRTGRGEHPGQIILQVMKETKIFHELTEENYSNFITKELALRKLVDFPPFKKFYQIQIQHKTEFLALTEAEILAEVLLATSKELNITIQVLGPFNPPVHKICTVHIQEILIKGETFAQICKILQNLELDDFFSRLTFRPLF